MYNPPMAYEVTATRKRPQNFTDLAGQEFVVSTLTNSIESGRIAHAYLFSGPRGVGKTSAARILARAVNCSEGPSAEPCGKCSACIEIARGQSLDVIEIDGASNTSVNDVREIKDEVLFTPNSSRYKVYIIDEVHMLSNSAFNALLKTIEEPPPYVIFIFATTEIHKVPATIRSRCQQFNFRLIPLELIKECLRQACTEMAIEAEEEALFWIAKEATGSLRDAYTLFDQVVSFSDGAITTEKIETKLGLVGFDRMTQLLEAAVQGKREDVFRLQEAILDSGVSVEQFLNDLTDYFRGILLLQNGIDKESLLGCSPDRYSTLVRETLSVAQVEMCLGNLFDLYRDIRYSLNPRFEVELLLSRLMDAPSFLSRRDMLERIEELKRDLAGGAPPPETGNPFLQQKKKADAAGFLKGRGADEEIREAPQAPPVPETSQREDSAVGDDTGEEDPPLESYDESVMEGSGSDEPAPGASTPEASGTEAPAGFTEESHNRFLQLLRRRKMSLFSGIQKADSWDFHQGILRFRFTNRFTAALVRESIPFLQEALDEIGLGQVRVEVAIGSAVEPAAAAAPLPEEDGHSPDREAEISETVSPVDRQVEAIKKVFRGEIVKERN